MKKEYDADILQAFSQSYFTGILVNVGEDRYEVLHLASWMRHISKEGGTVGLRIIQKGHAPEGFADYDFVVKDNGIGMSEEFAEHIFEPFTREETSTVSRIPGTGLGMAITKNIVDMMGGTIKVKSELGVGSEFTISLRFKITQQNSKRGVIKELNGFRALVADDSMDSCASVEKMLRRFLQKQDSMLIVSKMENRQ